MQERAMEKWAEQLRSCPNWSREQAREVLERQQASGDSMTAFARRMGFVPQRLFWWKSRLQPGPEPKAAQSFVPVVVREQAAETGARISVELGGGIRVQVNHVDAATASRVALLLRAREQS